MGTWERGPDEPSLWYDRFERYRLAGAARSLLKLYNDERERKGQKRASSPPTAWREMARTWQWERRAEDWDEAERQRARAAAEQDRQQEREARLTLLRAGRSRLAQALAALDATKLKPIEVFRALSIILQESRAEYDDQPTQRVSTEPVPPIDWDRVPDEIQVAFLERKLTLAQVIAYVAAHQPDAEPRA